MATGDTIVKKMLQKAGVITKQEEPTADESSDGIDLINGMLASWSNESLSTYYRPLESFTVTVGQATYTIGSGGDFDTVRPIEIISMYMRRGAIDYSMESLSDRNLDLAISTKNTRAITDFWNYNPNTPLGTVTLYPVPATADTLFIRSEKPLTAITASGDVDFPAGWEHAIIHNGAVLVGPEYGLEVSPAIQKEATRSKAAIQRTIAKNKDMDVRPMMSGGEFNIYTGRLD